MRALARARLAICSRCGLAVAAAMFGSAAAEPANPAARGTAGLEYHLVFTSDRDGDKDVYAVGERGGRLAALTRNRADDWWLSVAPSGWFYVDRTPAFLVSPDGRRERKLGTAAGDAAFSPDGELLAYGRENPVDEQDRVAVVPVGGGRTRFYGSGLPDVFSRDGRYLAFHDGDALGVVDLRTGRRTRLPSVDADMWLWSPQLTRVAYLEEDPTTGGDQLAVFGARPRSPKSVLERGNLSQPTWLDDDRLGIVDYDEGIVVFDLRAGTRTVVEPADTASGHYGLAFATWSPAGDAVAYLSGEEYGPTAIVAARFGGGDVRHEVPDRVDGLTWSPRGDAIAVQRDGGEIDVLDLAPSPRLRTLATGIKDVYDLVWSPDSRALAIVRRSGISLIPAAGGPAHTVAALRNVDRPLWWARGPVPPMARTAARPPGLDTRTTRLRAVPRSGTIASFAGSVSAFAQDGNRLAWIRDSASSTAPFPSVVEVLDVARQTRTAIGGVRRDATALNPGLYPVAFALGGGRALLVHLSGGACGLCNCDLAVLTASLADRRLRTIDAMKYATDEQAPGLRVLAAGDSGTILYYERCFSSEDCGAPGSVVRRVSGRRSLDVLKLADDRYPTALAVSGSRFAIADRTAAGKTTMVSIRAVRNGVLVAQFGIAALVSELALSPTHVAALVSARRSARLELRDARSGALRRRVQVPRNASSLSLAGERVVFRTGKTIRLVDAQSGRTSILATAAAIPIGLSIEGARVAWAEDARGRARIRAIALGR
jgi:hypothetical protein